MAAVFGVHVGNSSACLACFRDGKIEVVANEAGYRVTPAVVSFTEGEKITGLEAKAALSRNFSSTIIHNKLFMYMNLNDSEVSNFLEKSNGKIFIQDDKIKYRIQQGEKEVILSPDEVATCIYKSMIKIAKSTSRNEASQKAVLTVPLNLSDSALKRTRAAAEEAGFDVLQLISEPCAAVLAYEIGMQDPSQSCLCLVYRVGGASIDATVVRVAGGVYSVESSVQSKDLGGDQLNNLLADFIAAEFQRKFKLDPHESRRSISKLLSAAENWKHVLSNLGSADCFLESLHEGIDFRLNVSRARFEMLVSNNLQDCLQPIHAALKKANLDSSSITHVVQCGGSLKIPKLQKSLNDLFPKAELLGGLNPDEVLAIGAARQASYLPENWDKSFSDLSITVSAASKGILAKLSINDDGWQCIIPANAPIPFIKQTKCTIPEGSTSILAEIAEETESGNPLLLGKVELCDMSPGAAVVLEIKWTSMGLQASLSDRTNKRSVVEITTGE